MARSRVRHHLRAELGDVLQHISCAEGASIVWSDGGARRRSPAPRPGLGREREAFLRVQKLEATTGLCDWSVCEGLEGTAVEISCRPRFSLEHAIPGQPCVFAAVTSLQTSQPAPEPRSTRLKLLE